MYQAGHITETSIEDLSIVINLAKDIHVKNTETESDIDFYKYFPTFFWVLRDFSLELEKSSKDYLEDNLKPKAEDNEEIIRENNIRRIITSYFPERDCFTLIRPINEESKIAHIEEMEYSSLRPEFTSACDNLMKQILSRVRVKIIDGIPLTANMFMGLALEYIQSLNDKETPTILTSLERVLLDEARKHSESIFENFNAKLHEKLNILSLPMDDSEFNQTINQCKLQAINSFIRELHELCCANDLVDSFNKFESRLKVEIDAITESNLNLSEEKAKELLQELVEKASFPKVDTTTDIKPTLMIEFTGEWSRIIEDYYKHAKGPGKHSVLSEFAKQRILSSISDLVKGLFDAYTESENKLRLYLTELQISDKKWKTLFENNEKLLIERTQEKDELMAKNSELELKYDQLQRELKSKENDIKSLKNYQAIEISNLKQLNETMMKEKTLVIEDILRKHESMAAKLSEIEVENQKLQNENIRNMTQLKNNNKILEQTLDENKKKPKGSEDQNIVATLYKNIKASLDEFKTLIGDVEDNAKLKKHILDLQKELNDKEFEGNKKILDIRKEMGSELTETKLKHENEVRTLITENDLLKQTNSSLQV